MKYPSINNVMTFREASDRWGLDSSTLRKLVKTTKLEEGKDYRKSGDIWLITYEAMKKTFGNLSTVLYVGKEDVLTEEEFEDLSESEDTYQRLWLSFASGDVFSLIDFDYLMESELKQQLKVSTVESGYENMSVENCLVNEQYLKYFISNGAYLVVHFYVVEEEYDDDGDLTDDTQIEIADISIAR